MVVGVFAAERVVVEMVVTSCVLRGCRVVFVLVVVEMDVDVDMIVSVTDCVLIKVVVDNDVVHRVVHAVVVISRTVGGVLSLTRYSVPNTTATTRHRMVQAEAIKMVWQSRRCLACLARKISVRSSKASCSSFLERCLYAESFNSISSVGVYAEALMAAMMALVEWIHGLRLFLIHDGLFVVV